MGRILGVGDMQEKSVVVIGGGPGTDVALTGLKRHTSSLTALVSTFDSASLGRFGASNEMPGNGSSAGIHTRHANGGHPSEEVRNSLLALGTDPATTTLMEQLFSYKFSNSSDLGGYTFGNLFLSALTDITGATDLALQAAARVLNVQGQVLPATLHECPLVAELADGREVEVTTPAGLIEASAGAGLLSVRLARPTPALGAALRAVEAADILILGPADLFFGLVAPLQLEGMREALASSSAVKIFVCNTVTQRNTTSNWPASRFIRTLLAYTGGLGSLDCVIINSAPLPQDLLSARHSEGSAAVRFDLDECLSLGLNVIVRPVTAPESTLHDPEKLARTILFLGGGRTSKRTDRKGLFGAGSVSEVAAPAPFMPRLAES